jgi:putative transcriptional regulator
MYIILHIQLLRLILKLENNLRQFRFEHNEMTQQDLANAVGVSRLTIHSIETGKFNPSTLLSLKIANFFGVSVEDIFFLVDKGTEQ